MTGANSHCITTEKWLNTRAVWIFQGKKREKRTRILEAIVTWFLWQFLTRAYIAIWSSRQKPDYDLLRVLTFWTNAEKCSERSIILPQKQKVLAQLPSPVSCVAREIRARALVHKVLFLTDLARTFCQERSEFRWNVVRNWMARVGSSLENGTLLEKVFRVLFVAVKWSYHKPGRNVSVWSRVHFPRRTVT